MRWKWMINICFSCDFSVLMSLYIDCVNLDFFHCKVRSKWGLPSQWKVWKIRKSSDEHLHYMRILKLATFCPETKIRLSESVCNAAMKQAVWRAEETGLPLATKLTKRLKSDLELMRGSDCCLHRSFDRLHCYGHLKRQLCLKQLSLLHDLSTVVWSGKHWYEALWKEKCPFP